MTAPTLREQAEACDRELKLRRRVYPRRVAAEQMTQQLADREIARMEAAFATLDKLAREEEAKGRLL